MSVESITKEIREKVARLNHVLRLLEGGGNHTAKAAKAPGGRRKLSAAGRRNIVAAQRARWARTKGPRVVSIAHKGRTMSPAARKRIVAAQKARWAKWRKARAA